MIPVVRCRYCAKPLDIKDEVRGLCQRCGNIVSPAEVARQRRAA